MNWKDHLAKLEHNKQWDTAIEYMQHIVVENPDNLDVYLSINYLLMNLLVEEDYDTTKHDYYAALAKKYFDKSYSKFKDNPSYLFYIARIAAMSEWYFDIEIEDVEKMLQKAMALDPQNPLYQWTYYGSLDTNYVQNKDQIIAYSQLILQNNSPIKKELVTQGALGEYIWSMMKHWAERMVSGGRY